MRSESASSSDVECTSAAHTRTSLRCVQATSAPRSASSSSIVSTSRMRGMLPSTTGSEVSSVAASSVSAAFLLPSGRIVPVSGTPPSMTRNSCVRGRVMTVRGVMREGRRSARSSRCPPGTLQTHLPGEPRAGRSGYAPRPWMERPSHATARRRSRCCRAGRRARRCGATPTRSRRPCAPTRASAAPTRTPGATSRCCTTSTTSATPRSTSTRRTARRSCASWAIPSGSCARCCPTPTTCRTWRARESELELVLFACDELAGFVHACGLVRPEGLATLEPRSVRKKLKQKSFAAGVNRDDVVRGRRGPRRRPRRAHPGRDRRAQAHPRRARPAGIARRTDWGQARNLRA